MRNSTAWEKLTKCVEGTNCITFCRKIGMLSSGVWPPDKQTHHDEHREGEQAELRHRAHNRREHDSERGDREEVDREARTANSGIEPAIGTPISPFTTRNSDSIAAMMTTMPFAQILANISSNGLQRHDQQVLDVAVLALAQHRGAASGRSPAPRCC